MSSATRILRRIRREWCARRPCGPVDWLLLALLALLTGYGLAASLRRIVTGD